MTNTSKAPSSADLKKITVTAQPAGGKGLSLTEAGKLPSGVGIGGHHIESGTASLGPASNKAITFTKAFTSNPVMTLGTTVNTNSNVPYFTGLSTTGATIENDSGTQSVVVHWIAYGI